jgi:xanthine dehydrogenase YagS FAD-binding subunit
MRNFTYGHAASIGDAVSAAAGGAALAAGTTELLNWMRLGIAHPERVVDVSRLPDLDGIRAEEGRLVIGALATLGAVGAHALVRERAPVLAEACLRAASPQLRNRATLGGNVLQRTRCPFFRAEAPVPERMPWACNKRVAGSGCSALEGGWERAALFGWTDACAATQPSDPAVALAALGAEAEVQGPRGVRRIAMSAFHLTQEEAARTAPTSTTAAFRVETQLRSDEIILRYHVPADAASRRSAYLKVRERESYEYAMVSVAACLDATDGRIRQLRLALGSVAQKPVRLAEAETRLRDAPLAETTIRAAIVAALGAARPLPGQAWKTKLVENAAVRAVLTAGGIA